MKGYIYFIKNDLTGATYVGKTRNIEARISRHKSNLSRQIHINKKLQANWDKYGKDSFVFEWIEYPSISEELLNTEEIALISDYQEKGLSLNLAEGGTGGNTRAELILTFEDFCFAYFGNQKHKNLINRTAIALGCDSSTISALVREVSYNSYRNRALKLTEEEKEFWVKKFEEKLDLKNNPPNKYTAPLTDEEALDFICLISAYGRGVEMAFLRKRNRGKGMGHQIKKGMSYQKPLERYRELSENEVFERADRLFQTESLQDYSTQKIKRNKEIKRI